MYQEISIIDDDIKLTEKLNIPSDAKWDITTIWGVGYRFEVK